MKGWFLINILGKYTQPFSNKDVIILILSTKNMLEGSTKIKTDGSLFSSLIFILVTRFLIDAKFLKVANGSSFFRTRMGCCSFLALEIVGCEV